MQLVSSTVNTSNPSHHARGAERRRHTRIEVVKAIFLQALPRGIGRAAEGPVIKCETVDVSIKGLRLLVPEPIAIGTRVQLAVPDENWVENLELVGEARWLQEADDGRGYWLGLELQDTNRDNMEKWFKIVSKLQNRKG
ncbi:MAG: PilZ domain-containing protein [Halioglobus sp.]|nr:PilZ domain-containing protein [Halioglobus sp.]